MTDETTEQQRAAGWKRDPWKKFAGRYWDGTQWTEHVVSEERVRGVDPVPEHTVDGNGAPPSAGSAPLGHRPAAEPADGSAAGAGGDEVRGWPSWAWWAVAMVAGLALLGAVAATLGDGEPPSPGARAAGTSAGADSATCQGADAQLRRILEGLRGGAVALRKANVVALDPAVGGLRFVVAAEIDGAGDLADDGQIAVWGTPAADGRGPTLALDENARRYSTWGEDAAEGSSADKLRDKAAARPEVAVARRCAGG